MSNILHNTFPPIDFKLCLDSYWDFCPTDGFSYTVSSTNDCLSAYIDTTNPDCVYFDTLSSVADCTWEDAYNKGINTNYIGYTGVDNGYIHYQKDRISNAQFYELFTNSNLTLAEDDKRFFVTKVNGNNDIYAYDNDIVEEDGIICARLNGGFYQGFFKLFQCEYQVLPDEVGDGITLEFKLKKCSFENDDKLRLNDRYADNKGIFFYMGTRAENKWWRYYVVDEEFEAVNNGYAEDSYVNDGYLATDGNLNDSYLKEEDECEECTLYSKDGYFSDGYLSEEHTSNKYVVDGYIAPEQEIDVNEKIYTSDGYDFAQPNIYEISTDNKFILFHRGEDGLDINTWDEDAEYVLSGVKPKDMPNYFTLFHRGKGGYDVNTIQDMLDYEGKRYDILEDLYNNAIAFQIKDDGSIGYKYLVRDCDSEDAKYKIESEFSNTNVVTDGEWHTIHVVIRPRNDDDMRLYFYVDGNLCLCSQELTELDLRALDDLYEKQVGVPYNISIGGGTQGLCDVIYFDYRKLPTCVFPIEKEFAGSFVGYFKSFKYYSCALGLSEMREDV